MRVSSLGRRLIINPVAGCCCLRGNNQFVSAHIVCRTVLCKRACTWTVKIQIFVVILSHSYTFVYFSVSFFFTYFITLSVSSVGLD